MIDIDTLQRRFGDTPFARWADELPGIVENALNHGHVPQWRDILNQLPFLQARSVSLNQPVINIGDADEIDPDQRRRLETLLKQLIPWRKGPFRVFGIDIDCEWRSDLKWQRLAPFVSLAGQTVLDVGCGNGYYGLRMLGAGARQVIGVDPHLLYIVQYLALSRFLPPAAMEVLPCGLEALPGLEAFDTVFSMGVIYHRRSPLDHLHLVKQHLAPGGRLVMESIVVDGNSETALVPTGRYARMRNVWFVPSSAALVRWLQRCGFHEVEVIDQSPTTVEEQRRTPWMPYESLADGLDPDKPGLTIEGLPAPQRAVVTARKPPLR